MADKVITDDDIKKVLEPVVEKVKKQMVVVNKTAVDAFYSSPHPSYNRTNSFFNVVSHEPDIEYSSDGCIMTYKYNSSDVSVNEWESPWGVTYPGDPEWAFITAFEQGTHGGPRPLGGGVWSWERTNKTDPIIRLIDDGIKNLEF